MRFFYILLYFLGHILRSNILRYCYSIIYLHHLSSSASLDAISKFTPIQVAFACQAKVCETGRRSRFVALQRMSSHNPTTTHTLAVLSHTTTHHLENHCHELHAKNRLSIIDKQAFRFPSLTPNLTDGEVVSLAIRSRKPSRLEPWPVALSLKSHAPEGENPLQLPLQGPAHPSSTWCTVNRA
jgi:hypothetical protein